ncbi:unnamed protein product [Scytosiphon promiscuus]
MRARKRTWWQRQASSTNLRSSSSEIRQGRGQYWGAVLSGIVRVCLETFRLALSTWGVCVHAFAQRCNPSEPGKYGSNRAGSIVCQWRNVLPHQRSRLTPPCTSLAVHR